MPDLTGKDIGRYHVIEPIGQGGMATVYKALDTTLEREVALKVIRTEEFGSAVLARIQQRFEREAKTLARLNHIHIVPIIDYGQHESAPYLVMPFFPGGTLKALMGQIWDEADAARLLLPLADALGYAHRKGVLHRDLKPANVLLNEDRQPMLTDFGIAKLLEGGGGQTLTGTGVGIGTPEYMAPEQSMGKEVDARADVYALGVILFEMVTGKKPYSADTPMAVIVQHIHDPLPRPRDLNPNLSEGCELALFKALAKQPENRYADMDALRAALAKVAAGEKPAPLPARPLAMDMPVAEQTTEMTAGLTVELGTGLGKAALTAPEKPESAPADDLAGGIEQNASEMLVQLGPNIQMAFVRVPAGSFIMGCSDGEDDEKPEHRVHLDEYWISKYPVTNEQYYLICQDSTSSGSSALNYPEYKYNHPVVNITWDEAKAFCEYLGQELEMDVDLPSEAQWEKAGRGMDGRKYPWGNVAPNRKVANYGQIIGGTSAVGFFSAGASPYGAEDMAGNVLEWVLDWYAEQYYAQSPINNPTGPKHGQYRVVRGGSYDDSEVYLRTTSRDWNEPEIAQEIIGFRCVILPKEGSL